MIETLPPRAATDFDAVAPVYDESLPAHVVAHYLTKRLTFIKQHVPPGPALDVGCGTGLLAERLADAGYAIVGLDPSRGMLRQLHQRRPDLPGVAASGTALPFADETFALTYCIAVLHHVAEPAAVRRTLTEMARVTRPGGQILVWDHNPRNPYWPLLMKRVPQDTGAERLIPTAEIVAGLRAGSARPVLIRQSGFVPDFVPRRLLGVAALAERIVETVPMVNRLCAHNVVLAVKG
ncbi:MAG: class I SAM-dependent methyltransferase [Thermomicrobiales bacterium]